MIQKTIKGFLGRRVVDKLREQELLFLGILKKPQNPKDPNTALYKMNKNRERGQRSSGSELKRLQINIRKFKRRAFLEK